ncbi:MAG: hypothetical protein ACOY4U_10630 [Pseudomonadota bacterium]
MATIELDSNGNLPANTLKQSTNPRGSAPNGNIYFDLTNGEIQLITADELATVDFGGGPVANPLLNSGGAAGGITARALYKFERQERKADEALRKYDYFMKGSFKFAGAYEMVNGRKIVAADVKKLRSSGMVWRAASGAVNRIYFGARSLGSVGATSQPYFQLASGGAPTNLSYQGDVNEMIQVYGTTANGDTGAGNFDSRTYLALSLRTFGKNHDRKLLSDSGISAMDGFSAGFALGESNHLTTGSYTLADVYGGAQIAPWTGMTLEQYGAAQPRSGFVNAGNKNYTYILHNTNSGTLNEVVAYLDAIAQTDNDIDIGAGVINGKRVNTWYSYDAQGRIVTKQGLHIDNLPESDKQRIVQTDDSGVGQTYPFNVEVRVKIGNYPELDANAWFHGYFLDGAGAQDFNTANAVTLRDAGTPTRNSVKGLLSAFNGTTAIKYLTASKEIVFSYPYDSDTDGGLSAGIDKWVVFEVEGNGVATHKKAIFQITRIAVVSATCEPEPETNL